MKVELLPHTNYVIKMKYLLALEFWVREPKDQIFSP